MVVMMLDDGDDCVDDGDGDDVAVIMGVVMNVMVMIMVMLMLIFDREN